MSHLKVNIVGFILKAWFEEKRVANQVIFCNLTPVILNL